MAESFFVRKTVRFNNVAADFNEEEIDMGAFIDVQSGSLVRLLRVQVVYSDNTGRSTEIQDHATAATQWQLTTQPQSDIVLASDKTVVASGRIIANGGVFVIVGSHLPTAAYEDFDLNPSDWENSYLIATESLYLGGSASNDWTGAQYVTIILECSMTKMTKEKAIALAMSSQ